MATEIERKYLVAHDGWRQSAISRTHIRQGCLAQNERVEVRVRIKSDGGATLTIKASGGGVKRAEFDFDASLKDADALLQQCGDQVLEKLRHTVTAGGRYWLVDEYRGRLAGLVLAEIELNSIDDMPENLPDWLGREVTGQREYANASLALAGLPQVGNDP